MHSSDEDNILSEESDDQDLPDIKISIFPSLHTTSPAKDVKACTSELTERDVLKSLKDASPLKMYSQNEDQTRQGEKLLRKASDLGKDIKSKEEIDRKIAAIKQGGGIMRLTRELEEAISRSDEEHDQGSGGCISPGLGTSSPSEDGSSPLPAKPPGRLLFDQQPSFYSELYPPCLDVSTSNPSLDQLLLHDNHLALRDIIVTGVLFFVLQGRPCPRALWVWLFQLMCRSQDTAICIAALKILNDLAFSGKKHGFEVFCPPVSDVVDVLIALGANKALLLENTCSDDAQDSSRDDVFVPPHVSHVHLSCIVRYLSTSMKLAGSLSPYSAEDVRRLVVLLVKVCLDPAVHGSLIQSDLVWCIGALIHAICDRDWATLTEQLCTELEQLSNHHHNQLYVAQLISITSERQHQLTRTFVRQCITKILQIKDNLEDIDFVKSVLMTYYSMDPSEYDFYQMLSVLKMLNLYLPPSRMKWASLECKQTFTRLLMSFASSRLKDRLTLDLRCTAVKNYVLDMKMEVDDQVCVDGPRQRLLSFPTL